jgi:hypothetical protein
MLMGTYFLSPSFENYFSRMGTCLESHADSFCGYHNLNTSWLLSFWVPITSVCLTDWDSFSGKPFPISHSPMCSYHLCVLLMAIRSLKLSSMDGCAFLGEQGKRSSANIQWVFIEHSLGSRTDPGTRQTKGNLWNSQCVNGTVLRNVCSFWKIKLSANLPKIIIRRWSGRISRNDS